MDLIRRWLLLDSPDSPGCFRQLKMGRRGRRQARDTTHSGTAERNNRHDAGKTQVQTAAVLLGTTLRDSFLQGQLRTRLVSLRPAR